MFLNTILPLMVAAFVAFALWRSLTPPWTLHLVFDGQAITFIRGVPLSKRQRLAEFVENDLRPAGKLVLRARKLRNGRLVTSIQGAVDAATTQRIRNFLLDVL